MARELVKIIEIPAKFRGHYRKKEDLVGKGNTKVYLHYGNGCRKHPDCFNCPEIDCICTTEQARGY